MKDSVSEMLHYSEGHSEKIEVLFPVLILGWPLVIESSSVLHIK